MTSDGYFEPVPACQRAVMEAVESLRSQGHEVVPFEIPYSMAQLVETYIALMGADGNWCVFSSPSPSDPFIGTTISSRTSPRSPFLSVNSLSHAELWKVKISTTATSSSRCTLRSPIFFVLGFRGSLPSRENLARQNWLRPQLLVQIVNFPILINR